MIRVHCFVSCVCDLLQRAGVDERPFYFGVWDAEFSLENEVLSYHCPNSDQSFFRQWYERLHGVAIHQWYDRSRTKEENVQTLLSLMDQKPPERHVMVMLDLFALPERENKFNQDPFPHYVMVEPSSEPAMWLMRDPDFRWQGQLRRGRIVDAMRRPSAHGGFVFEESGLHAAGDDDIEAYFRAGFVAERNPLTEAIRTIVTARLADGRLAGLAHALREIPVMAIRKYAYEHGFAFFWRALGLPDDEFEGWCDLIEDLVKNYKIIHYRALKLVASGRAEQAGAVLSLLEKQDALERRIKEGLRDVFAFWSEQRREGLPVLVARTREAEVAP